jgi:hypothetical protein
MLHLVFFRTIGILATYHDPGIANYVVKEDTRLSKLNMHFQKMSIWNWRKELPSRPITELYEHIFI